MSDCDSAAVYLPIYWTQRNAILSEDSSACFGECAYYVSMSPAVVNPYARSPLRLCFCLFDITCILLTGIMLEKRFCWSFVWSRWCHFKPFWSLVGDYLVFLNRTYLFSQIVGRPDDEHGHPAGGHDVRSFKLISKDRISLIETCGVSCIMWPQHSAVVSRVYQVFFFK